MKKKPAKKKATTRAIKLPYKLYKVLVDGRSPGTGGAEKMKWPQPNEKTNKPGRWVHDPNGEVVLVCCRGLHVVKDPISWIAQQWPIPSYYRTRPKRISVYLVEVSGFNGGWDGSKTCYSSVRLVRRIHKHKKW